MHLREWEDSAGRDIQSITMKIFDDGSEDRYKVGCGGVTKIEKDEKSGMHGNIP